MQEDHAAVAGHASGIIKEICKQFERRMNRLLIYTNVLENGKQRTTEYAYIQ